MSPGQAIFALFAAFLVLAAILSVVVANRATRIARASGIGPVMDAYRVEQKPQDAVASWCASVFIGSNVFRAPASGLSTLVGTDGLVFEFEPNRWYPAGLVEQLFPMATVAVVPWDAISVRRKVSWLGFMIGLGLPNSVSCDIATDAGTVEVVIWFPLGLPRELVRNNSEST